MLGTIYNFILPFLLSYKYLALFIITFLASSIIPIPPGTLIIASSALSFGGHFNFGWVVFFSILGNVLGDNVSYWLSYKYGNSFFKRIGLRKLLESGKYKSVADKIKRKPGIFLFFSRFEVTINLLTNIFSGVEKINYRKFFILTALGEVAQIFVYASIGYFFGGYWKTITSVLSYLLLGGIIIVIILLIRQNKRYSKK